MPKKTVRISYNLRKPTVKRDDLAGKIDDACAPDALGKRILQARAEAGLTQIDLGKLFGLTASSIQQWEAGATAPSLHRVGLIADALGVSRAWLMTGGEIKGSAPQASTPPVVGALVPASACHCFSTARSYGTFAELRS